MGSNPVVRPLGKRYKKAKFRSASRDIDEENKKCLALKAASLAAIGKLSPETQCITPQAGILHLSEELAFSKAIMDQIQQSVPASISRCVKCHSNSTGDIPLIPFNDPGRLAHYLGGKTGPTRFNVMQLWLDAPDGSSKKMPPGGPKFSTKEIDETLSYLRSYLD